MLRGDATVAGEAFPNATVAASAAALLQAWATQSGPLVRVEFLGTRVVARVIAAEVAALRSVGDAERIAARLDRYRRLGLRG